MRKSYYNASKGYSHSITTRGDGTNLAVNGKIIDTIQEVLHHSFEDLQHDDLSGKYPVKKVFHSLLQFLKRESRWQPPHRTILGAVVRTLIGGFILSMDDLHVLNRLPPPETDLSELLLDYSDDLGLDNPADHICPCLREAPHRLQQQMGDWGSRREKRCRGI